MMPLQGSGDSVPREEKGLCLPFQMLGVVHIQCLNQLYLRILLHEIVQRVLVREQQNRTLKMVINQSASCWGEPGATQRAT